MKRTRRGFLRESLPAVGTLAAAEHPAIASAGPDLVRIDPRPLPRLGEFEVERVVQLARQHLLPFTAHQIASVQLRRYARESRAA